MKYLFIIATILTSLFFYLSFNGLFDSGIIFLIPIAVIVFWFSKFPFEARLCFAAGMGFFFDNFSPHTFGTYLILFFLLALAVECIYFFISDKESMALRAAYGAILTLLFIALLPAVHFFLP